MPQGIIENENGKFTILNISDIQDGYPINPLTKKYIEDTVDMVKPDLIVLTGDNISGYDVPTKEEAELAAKYYDNYRYAKVKTNGGTIRVREGASTSTSILGELEKIATHYGIIRQGRMIMELSAEEMDSRAQVFTSLKCADMQGAKAVLKKQYADVREEDGYA